MANKTLSNFLSTHLIKIASCTQVTANPNMTDVSGGMRHWEVTLEGMFHNGAKRTMQVTFSQGAAHTAPPNVEDVIDVLISDAASIHEDMGFEAWAADLGLDPDSRKAEVTYNAVRAQTERFKNFLGESFLVALEVERS